jgi:hypothetical protein
MLEKIASARFCQQLQLGSVLNVTSVLGLFTKRWFCGDANSGTEDIRIGSMQDAFVNSTHSVQSVSRVIWTIFLS